MLYGNKQFQILVVDRQLRGFIIRATHELKYPKKVIRAAAMEFRDEIKENIKAGGRDRAGNRGVWIPRAPSTIRASKRKTAVPGKETGKMSNPKIIIASPTHAIIRFPKYARWFHVGNRKGQQPARKLFILPEKAKMRIAAIIKTMFLFKELTGRFKRVRL